MNDVLLLIAQTRYALRGFVRNPRALVFTIIMPIFLLLVFNATFSGSRDFGGLGFHAAPYYTAAVIAYAIMQSGFSSLLISVTTDREAGLLKRFRGTPMPNWVYLAAAIGQMIALAVVTVAVLLAVGVILYGVSVSAQTLVGVAIYVVLGTASLCAVALAISRICATTDTATAIGPFVTVILSFLSGVFIPVSIMPSWLLDIGKLFPLEHLAQGLRTAFLVSHQTGVTAANVGVILAWGVAGMLVAIASFRWEPLASGAA
jgi:ABC-2 type transport system permease protein